MLGDVAGVVDVVERAAAAGGAAFGHEFRQSALIPELHGEADDGLALALQHSRDDGAIHSAGHGYGDRWAWTDDSVVGNQTLV